MREREATDCRLLLAQRASDRLDPAEEDFHGAVDRFAYRHVFPFPRQVPMTELRNHRAEIEAEIARVKAWSPRSVLVRQFAGQLYSMFGMADRAKAEFVDGYRLDPGNPFWEPQLKALGAWPPG